MYIILDLFTCFSLLPFFCDYLFHSFMFNLISFLFCCVLEWIFKRLVDSTEHIINLFRKEIKLDRL